MSDLTKRLRRLATVLTLKHLGNKSVLEAVDHIERLENPTWGEFIDAAEKWLEQYPEDIFNSSNNSPGPVFITTLREALRTLKGKL